MVAYGRTFFATTITFAPPHFEDPKGGHLDSQCFLSSPFSLFLDIVWVILTWASQGCTQRERGSARKKARERCFFIDFISPRVFLLSELTLHS